MKKVVLGTLLALFLPVISHAQMGGGMMGGGMMGGGMMGPDQGREYQGQPFQRQGQGAEIFRANCIKCHARGGNLIQPNLPLKGAPQLAHFNTFLAFIRNPTMPDGSRGPMPAFPPETIPNGQARDLYQYLVAALGGPVGGGSGPGDNRRPGYGGRYGPQYQQPSRPLSERQAKQQVEGYLKSTRNPNLKLGKIEDKKDAYEVEIVTKDGSLVNKILVDKNSGRMRSVY